MSHRLAVSCVDRLDSDPAAGSIGNMDAAKIDVGQQCSRGLMMVVMMMMQVVDHGCRCWRRASCLYSSVGGWGWGRREDVALTTECDGFRACWGWWGCWEALRSRTVLLVADVVAQLIRSHRRGRLSFPLRPSIHANSAGRCNGEVVGNWWSYINSDVKVHLLNCSKLQNRIGN